MTAPRVACFSEVGDDLGQWRGYGGSMRLCYRFPLRWHLRGVEGPTERALAADALRGRGTPTSCRQGAAYGAAIFPSRVFSADFLTSQDGHENSSMHCDAAGPGAAPSRQRTTTACLADCRRTFRAPYLAPQSIFVLRRWSEWQDLNLRPPRPERGARPD